MLGVTVFYSVVAGVIAGCLLAGTIFVINMSRPIVRRALRAAATTYLRPAKWYQGVSLHGSNPDPLMSALGHKRTSKHVRLMSALPPLELSCEIQPDVRH